MTRHPHPGPEPHSTANCRNYVRDHGAVRSRAGLLALLVAAGLWGLAVVMIRYACEQLPVATLALLDAGVAVVVLLALTRFTGRRVPRPTARLVTVSAFEPGVSYLLFDYGIAHTSGSHAALISGTQSALVVLVAAAVARRMPSAAVGLGVVLATAGAVLVAEHSTGVASVGGDLWVLAGTVASTLYIVFVRPLAARMDALELTTAQMLYGGLVTAPVAVLMVGTGGLPGFGWAPVPHAVVGVGVGLVGSVFSYGLYNWALGRTSASVAGVSLALIPVFGLAFSVLLLGDDLAGRVLIAAMCVVAGLLIVARAEPGTAEQHGPGP